MREIYFVPFEKAVKEGGSTAVMSSYNKYWYYLGRCKYCTMTSVLRNDGALLACDYG